MKFFFFISILLSMNTASATADCDSTGESGIENSSIGPLATSLVRKNCSSSMNFLMDKLATDDNEMEICGNCRTQFLSTVEPFMGQDKEELEKAKERAYVQTLFKELEKSVTGTLLDVVALRQLPKTSSTYGQSINACNTKSFVDQVKGCKGIEKITKDVSELSDRIANQVAQLLGTSSTSTGAERKSCSYNENLSNENIAQFHSLAVEESITPEMVQILSKLDSNLKPSDFNTQMTELLSASGEIAEELKKHPLLNALSKDPTKFVSFFKSLPRGDDQATLTSSLRSALATKEVGDVLDRDIAARCQAAFSGFQEKVCAPNFSAQNINLGRLENYERMMDGKSFHDDQEYATPAIMQDNYNLISFCPSSNTGDKPFSLQDDLKKMSGWMDEDDQKQLRDQYVTSRIIQQNEGRKSALCDNCQGKENTLICRMQKMADDHQKAKAQGTLASSTDPEVNNILRSFVGTPANITPEVRQVLVSEGILPQDNGSYVAKETSPKSTTSGEQTSAAAAVGAANGVKQSATGTAGESASAQAQGPRSVTSSFVPSAAPESTASDFSSTYDEKISQLSELSRAEEKRMQDIREEISRRLSQSPEARPTRDQVAQATQETLRRQNTRVSPARQTQMVDQLMREYTRPETTHFASSGFAGPSGDRVELGDDLAGPSEQSKQWNQALEDRLKGSAPGATATAAGGLAAGSTGRSPANTGDQGILNLPVVEINLRGGDFGSLESVLTEQLGNEIADNFKLELISAQLKESIQYQITRSADNLLKVTLLTDSPAGQRYVERIQEVLNRLYQDRNRARLSDLRNISF